MSDNIQSNVDRLLDAVGDLFEAEEQKRVDERNDSSPGILAQLMVHFLY